ncbi:rhamnogalacturonan acetylesterase [Dactylosporangium vinaceum]|uniref:Rhamnogalacturonan acetylesterase n=1 Tax=Dactylosporangium vinaceum TaxID=53362 RepID=A0ABV5MQZ1_9ACTN|nr:rhamnogalacturonan acetylesterase [Dactylosporangium vinaceum]UAC00671.1 rhamnogalacturonan acetylesterase [Dactylosporangium vinaceum]
MRPMLGALLVAMAAGPLALATPADAGGPHRPPHRITVFVAGDSTAATWPADTIPKAGWGQALPVFLDEHRADVDNRALSGASSKSFVEAGLLDAILAAIRPGDYLLISFGHNDEKTDERHTDPYTTFQDYLSRYIDGARAHGAHPVLVTPVERRRFNAEGHATPSHGDYPAAMLALGASRRVPVIDLTALSMALWDRAGVEGTKRYFLYADPATNPNFPDGVADNTHFQAHGAIEVARLVASRLQIRRLVPPGLVRGLHRDVPDTALIWPATIPVPA